MQEKKNKKKIVWQEYVGTGVFMLIGAMCGVFIADYLLGRGGTETKFAEDMWLMAGALVCIYIAIFIQTVVHEAGHLVFGLISGYKFVSFRIMSFMWLKENGKLKLKRFSLAGTGGQCLMSPPDWNDGNVPTFLYNMGGSFMNLILSFIFLGIYFLVGKSSFVSIVSIIVVLIGVAYAVLNGIPIRMGLINNDGYNAISIQKNKAALRSFWVQLKVNELIYKGVRLKDMPDEWFTVPDDEGMKDGMAAVMGVFCCNRLMDQGRLDEGNELMKHLLFIDSGMVGVHRHLLICDRISYELMYGSVEEATKLLTKEQKKFMKAMRKYPSVLRTQYIYALLAQKNDSLAETFRTALEKVAKTYPNPEELKAERELMDLAKSKAE